MIEKINFTDKSIQKLIKAINAITNENNPEIYSLSFWFFCDNDDQRFPKIVLGYNTISNYQDNIKKASDENEAKWNFAFWLQNEIEEIGGENDELLLKWFEKSNSYFSEKEIQESKENDKLYGIISERGSEFCNEFIEEIINISKKMFEENIIKNKFGKNIPIIIHELEYYDEPVNWTEKGNPKGLAKEFTDWVDSL